MIIAQLPTATSGQLGEWLVSAMAVVVGAYYVKKLLVRNPPMDKEFATKAELQNVEGRLSHELEVLDKRVETLVGSLDTRITTRLDMMDARNGRLLGELGEKISNVDRNLARIAGRLEAGDPREGLPR